MISVCLTLNIAYLAKSNAVSPSCNGEGNGCPGREDDEAGAERQRGAYYAGGLPHPHPDP